MTDEDLRWCDVCDDCSHYKAVGDEKYQCTLEGGRCRGYFAYKKLKAENAALRERLDKAVELPVKIGDTVYFLEHFCDYKGHFNKNCSKSERPFMCECEELVERSRKNEQFVISEKPFALQDLPQVDKRYFVTHEAAEAKLKEIQEITK